MIGRHQIVEAFGGLRRQRALRSRGSLRHGPELLADQFQASRVVLGHEVGHATSRSVHARAAERFGIHHLPHRALHQIRAPETHEAGAFHHDQNVAQRGQISSAGDARAHDRGDLRHVQLPAHQRVVIEDPGGAVLTGKDAVLIRQVHARRIHQVHNRRTIPHRDFLGAQNLGNGLRPPRSGLHGGVVGDNDGGPPFDLTYAGHHPRRRSLPFVLVVSDQQADLEKHGARIGELADALARGQFPIAMLLFGFLRTAALPQPLLEFLQTFDELPHAGRAGGGHVSRIQECEKRERARFRFQVATEPRP